jgi:type 1 glutamine amidotransferase
LRYTYHRTNEVAQSPKATPVRKKLEWAAQHKTKSIRRNVAISPKTTIVRKKLEWAAQHKPNKKH